MAEKQGKSPENDDADENEEVYEVEKIVGMCQSKDGVLYKVRWLGYGPSWDTWEPPDNLDTCVDLIEKYKNKHKQVKKPKQKADKSKPDTSKDVAGNVGETSKAKGSLSGASAKASSPANTSTDKPKEERKKTWYYVSSSDEEADTLKDKFWRELEEGKIDVFSNDLYSKVKATGRSSRPQSFKEMFKAQPLSTSPAPPPPADASTPGEAGTKPAGVKRRASTERGSAKKQPIKKQESKDALNSSKDSGKSAATRRNRKSRGSNDSKDKPATPVPADVRSDIPPSPYEEGVDCDGSAAVRDEISALMGHPNTPGTPKPSTPGTPKPSTPGTPTPSTLGTPKSSTLGTPKSSTPKPQVDASGHKGGKAAKTRRIRH